MSLEENARKILIHDSRPGTKPFQCSISDNEIYISYIKFYFGESARNLYYVDAGNQNSFLEFDDERNSLHVPSRINEFHLVRDDTGTYFYTHIFNSLSACR